MSEVRQREYLSLLDLGFALHNLIQYYLINYKLVIFVKINYELFKFKIIINDLLIFLLVYRNYNY